MEFGKNPIDHVAECLTAFHLVLVPAGGPRKPGMTRDDLFGTKAGIAAGVVAACACSARGGAWLDRHSGELGRAGVGGDVQEEGLNPMRLVGSPPWPLSA